MKKHPYAWSALAACPAADVRQRLANEGIEVRTSSSAATAKLYAEHYAKWGEVIRKAGIDRQ